MNIMLKGLAAAAVCSVFSVSSSWADNCTGTDSLVTLTSDITDLGQGLKKMTWTAESIVTSDDSIYKLIVGECSATMLTTPDGRSQSAGYCARHDKDGDTASISINQAPGADKSTWRATGGTGKYADKIGDSGWAQPIFAEGSVFVVKWGGDCK